jgi:hypothetical protein
LGAGGLWGLVEGATKKPLMNGHLDEVFEIHRLIDGKGFGAS